MSTMAKQDATAQAGFFSSLFQAGFYKPSQGRLVRQVLFAAVALLGTLLCYEVISFSFVQQSLGFYGAWGTFLVLTLVMFWFAFRLVNYPRFADFLISVEAELNKVSWPSRHVLWRATTVVIFVIFAMSAVLFVFDLIWTKVFEVLRVRY